MNKKFTERDPDIVELILESSYRYYLRCIELAYEEYESDKEIDKEINKKYVKSF